MLLLNNRSGVLLGTAGVGLTNRDPCMVPFVLGTNGTVPLQKDLKTTII